MVIGDGPVVSLRGAARSGRAPGPRRGRGAAPPPAGAGDDRVADARHLLPRRVARVCPFVEVGSTVEPDTVVCIIEVMKMMNSVTAGVAGTVVEVCPGNARLVEFGEPLFRVEPAVT